MLLVCILEKNMGSQFTEENSGVLNIQRYEGRGVGVLKTYKGACFWGLTRCIQDFVEIAGQGSRLWTEEIAGQGSRLWLHRI